MILTNHGANTQITSREHENTCYQLIQQHFNATELQGGPFRDLIRANGRQWINNSGTSLIDNPVVSIPITSNPLNLEADTPYIIKQPSGSQRYPDIAMIQLTDDNNLQIVYIECKQKRPTWNNTPPKRFRHCLYICGNQVFNGEIITSEDEQLLVKKYIQRYTELVREFNELTDIFKFVRYKKIELRQWPTQYFLDSQDQNIPLITETLSRFS